MNQFGYFLSGGLLECAMHLYDPEKSAKREGRLSPLSELQVKQFPDEVGRSILAEKMKGESPCGEFLF